MLIFIFLINFHIIRTNFNKFWAINKIFFMFFIFIMNIVYFMVFTCVLVFFLNFLLKGQYQTSQERFSNKWQPIIAKTLNLNLKPFIFWQYTLAKNKDI